MWGDGVSWQKHGQFRLVPLEGSLFAVDGRGGRRTAFIDDAADDFIA